MLVLRFDLESGYALNPRSESEENWKLWLDECLGAVSQVAAVLKRNEVPASFFIVGKVIERAGKSLASVLDSPRFDIESHTYSHMKIKSNDRNVLEQFDQELRQTSDLIVQFFGSRPTGFCAPGNFYRGLQGYPEQLRMLWKQGYTFVGSDGQGPPEQAMPAPFTQPYWYDEDGFPDLLEVPLTGWHCNMLFNTGHQNDYRKPARGFPDGTVLEKLPSTIEEGFQARKSEFEYAIDNDLIYAPCMHPWSVFRFDPQLEHVERLIQMAREKDVPVLNCKQQYETFREAKESALI
jgi:hypothetical protein